MPYYTFRHVKTGEVQEVFFHMNDSKDYRGPDGKARPGLWKRVWLKPQMAVDSTNVDVYNPKDFAKATRKKGTIGELHDRSAEWGEKRKDKDGVDPIQEKYFADYAKRHKGRLHPVQKERQDKAKLDKSLKKAGIKVEWGD